MPRWLPLLGLGVVGVALGLFYGWIVDPLRFLDTTPASLRADFRADYVLMIAEAFHAQRDADLARKQLAILGSESPATICAHALQTAQQVGYSPEDLSLVQELMLAMQAASPLPTAAGGPP